MALTLSEDAANRAAKAVTDSLNGGSVRVYGGRRPSRCGAPIADQPLLLEWRLADPAFSEPARGTATAVIPDATTALADGQATWYRVSQKDGTPSHDGSASAVTGDMVLTTTEIVKGALVALTLLVYRQRMD